MGERALLEPASWIQTGTPTLLSALQSSVGHLVCRVPPAILVCLPANSKDTVGHKWSFQSGKYGGGWGDRAAARSSTLTLWSALCLTVLQFLGGLVATIFLDIIYLGIFYPRSSLSDTVRFSAGMAILNLILKPISCFFVYQMYRERGGELLVHVGETTT